MPASLSIKNIPDDLLEKLRERAKRHHRSLQGELLVIIEEAVQGNRPITIEEAYRRVQNMGLTTPDESTAMIREDRDAR